MKDFLLDEDSLRSLFDELDIEIMGETGSDIIAFCPFHDNKNTPAFNLSKYEPSHPWHCWNESCGKSGTLIQLVSGLQGLSPIQAMKKIRSYRPTVSPPKKIEKREYMTLDSNMLKNLDTDMNKLTYMLGRGFEKETLIYFGVGFENGLIVVPVWDEFKNLVGFTCRATYPTSMKYQDTGLPKKFIMFNMNNAIRYDEVIIVEGPLDAMTVHQAGFPNVVSTMMGDISKWHVNFLRKNFKKAILFFDNDETGRAMTDKAAQELRDLRVSVVEYREGKDPGELTRDEIKYLIENSINYIEYKVKNNLKI